MLGGSSGLRPFAEDCGQNPGHLCAGRLHLGLSHLHYHGSEGELEASRLRGRDAAHGSSGLLDRYEISQVFPPHGYLSWLTLVAYFNQCHSVREPLERLRAPYFL